MILIIIIISLGKTLLSYIEHITHARAHTHQPTTIAILVVAVWWVVAANDDEVNAPFSSPLNGR